MYFTTSDPRPLPGAWWAQEWDLTLDGKPVGVITETERGYRGRLTVPEHTDVPEQVGRSIVVGLMIRTHLVRTAARSHITLRLDDITAAETGRPEIDSMPADEWLDAMAMD